MTALFRYIGESENNLDYKNNIIYMIEIKGTGLRDSIVVRSPAWKIYKSYEAFFEDWEKV